MSTSIFYCDTKKYVRVLWMGKPIHFEHLRIEWQLFDNAKNLKNKRANNAAYSFEKVLIFCVYSILCIA